MVFLLPTTSFIRSNSKVFKKVVIFLLNCFIRSGCKTPDTLICLRSICDDIDPPLSTACKSALHFLQLKLKFTNTKSLFVQK